MSHRRFRRIVIAAVILAMVSLVPPPVQGREIGWRDLGQLEIRGFLGNFQKALYRLFELSRSGMDPNGLPTGGGG